MINKTYIRVITLVLAVLMVLGMLAPMFTRVSFAASLLEVQDYGDTISRPVGTPTAGIFNDGRYEIEVKEITGTTVILDVNSEEKKEDITLEDNGKTLKYGGLRFTKIDGTKWEKGNKFNITFRSVIVDGEPKIVSSTANVGRIRKGRQVTLTMNIVDTNLADTNDVTDAYVVFEQGDFKRSSDTDSSGNPLDSIKVVKGNSGKLQFEVELKNLVYSGSGDTAKFTIGYTVDGQKFEYDMSIKVDGCVPYVDKEEPDDDDDEDVKLDPLTPHIIVNKYDYGATQVSAGQVLDLNLSFTNTSNQYDLDNIVMKITTPEGFAITSSSNTYYFDKLDVGQSISQYISLQANPSAEAKSHAITINFSFQYTANDTRRSGESSESISIPVSQPDRFSVDEVQVPTSIFVGEEYNVSVNFVNKGKAQVYNVTAELRGNMQNSGERTFIGNVNSGSENSADFYVTPTEPGRLEGEIVITYEDSNMNIKEVVKPFVIQVEEYPVYFPGEDLPVFNPEPVEEPGFFTTQNVVLSIVAIGVAGATCYMTILKTKAKRSEFDDEDL